VVDVVGVAPCGGCVAAGEDAAAVADGEGTPSAVCGFWFVDGDVCVSLQFFEESLDIRVTVHCTYGLHGLGAQDDEV
jgi:hypothetical protein